MQTKPGLVVLYDIRPGNGAGLFLQSPSPHRAVHGGKTMVLASPENGHAVITNAEVHRMQADRQ